VAPGSTLPAGLGLSSDGQLGGTLTAIDSGAFEVKVSDAMEKSATRIFSVNVVLPLTIETSSFGPAMAGTFFASMLEGRGGTGPYSWSLLAGSLPDGLALGPDGLLAGYPGSPGASFSHSAMSVKPSGAKGGIGDCRWEPPSFFENVFIKLSMI